MPAFVGSTGSRISAWYTLEEMCPTYKEFATLLVSDSERALVVALTRAGFLWSFMRMLGLSVVEARELVVDD
ncbi:hypothetical protein JCGZ_05981 [Jatropha curcas]|uniref:Uncharacterized protein n=1 Tax=Jatropha curcas TaxID=180498 RepID=A0A067KN27_JATCU|nr:hypothetical protein JCGZ_05981 [Jatropha curcas]